MSSTNRAREARRTFAVPEFGGFHSRPSMMFVDVARGFISDLVLEFEGEKYDCKFVMEVHSAMLFEGKTFAVHAYGDDCLDALDAIGHVLRDIAAKNKHGW